MRFDEERVSLDSVLKEAPRDSRSVHHLIDPILQQGENESERAFKIRKETRAQGFYAAMRRAGLVAFDENPAFYLVRSKGMRGEIVGILGLSGARIEGSTLGKLRPPTLLTYDDRDDEVKRSYKMALERESDQRFSVDGIEYELWIVDDETTTARMQSRLKEKDLFSVNSTHKDQAGLVFCIAHDSIANAALPLNLVAKKLKSKTKAKLLKTLKSQYKTEQKQSSDLASEDGAYFQNSKTLLKLRPKGKSQAVDLGELYSLITSQLECKIRRGEIDEAIEEDEIRIGLPLPRAEGIKSENKNAYLLQKVIPLGCVMFLGALDA